MLRSVPGVLSAKSASEVQGRHPAELRVRTFVIVVVTPSGQHLADVRQGAEQGLVEQLIPQAAIEALDEPVLLRLAGGDVMPADLRFVRPAGRRWR